MMRIQPCAFVALALFLTAMPCRSERIDINFYFDTNAYNTFGGNNPIAQAAREVFVQSVLDDMDVALVQSGLSQNSYDATFVDPAAFFLLGFASPSIELSLDTQVAADRFSYGGDVALIIVDEPFGACGDASKPATISSSNDDDFAFVALDFLCILAFEEVAPHEMGHILAADHEPADDPDEQHIAKPYNHAHIDTVNQLQTVMASDSDVCGPQCDMRVQYSDPARNFAGTSIVSGDSLVSDVVHLIDNDNSFVTVAGYRHRPPTITECGAEFFNCPPGCGTTPYLMWWEGQNASGYQVDRKNFLGIWTSYYSGSNSSSPASTGTLHAEYFRVRAVNLAGLFSGWCPMTLFVQCDLDQNPW